ncbi:MAG: RNA polymerase sigma factor [Gaiellaceae bacterium]
MRVAQLGEKERPAHAATSWLITCRDWSRIAVRNWSLRRSGGGPYSWSTASVRPVVETRPETAAAAESRCQPDVEIVRRAQRGDERAFSILVRTYETRVFAFVLRLVGDRSLAEDLTQEIFLRVFQGLPRFSFRSTFTTWLFQVSKNRVMDELRACDRRPRLVGIDEITPLGVADPSLEQGETMAAMWQAIERLPDDWRMALLLRDVAGLSYFEIAGVLEITVSTVKWRIFKAREGVVVALTRADVAFSRGSE